MEFRVSDTPFQAVNQYAVREKVGAGGMGTVYRAFDLQLRRDVALKVLNDLDPISLERFVREREITADLDHPNFVRILSMGYLATEQGQRPFYTMPLLKGDTLARLVQRRLRGDDAGQEIRGEFPFSRLLQLLQQICLAMESAHARGIVHGDLKPSNVIVGPYGELYVVDLGLAKYVRSGDDDAPSRPDASDDHGTDFVLEPPAGTPYYMAPEAILDPTSTDPRSDIFGLGGILYFILAGVPPQYRAPGENGADGAVGNRLLTRGSKVTATTTSILTAKGSKSASSRGKFMRALHGELVPPDEAASRRAEEARVERVRDPVDPAIAAICLKALARHPADRYPSAHALWQELQQYLEGRFELIHKREASELSRSISRRTAPAALRSYELAEQGLREKIVRQEQAGRFGLEEKIDLFDLLIDKAKVYERRGDTAAIVRSVARAEPVLETAMEVLQRQFARLLLARGTAQADQGDFAGAHATFERAVARATSERLDDLLAPGLAGLGAACAGLETREGDRDAERAFQRSIELADGAGDVAVGVSGRLGLARLLLRKKGRLREARNRLGEALARAGRDPALLCETRLALGAYHLGRGEPSVALHQVEAAMQDAREIDARNLVREGHFLLGQASHALGDPAGRAEHFREALHVRGLRRTDMERRISDFCAHHRLNPVEAGARGGFSP